MRQQKITFTLPADTKVNVQISEPVWRISMQRMKTARRKVKAAIRTAETKKRSWRMDIL